MIYRIEPSFRRTMFLCGIAFAIFAAFGTAVVVFDRGASLSSNVTLAVCSAVSAAVAWWSVRLARRPERFEVEITDEGIRISGGASIRWSDIATFRERRIRQRVDLLDAAGVRLGGIEYQIEKAGGVIEEVRRRSRVAKIASPKTIFGKRRAVSDLVLNGIFFLAFCGLGVQLWFYKLPWLAVCVPLGIAWALYGELRDDVRQVELGEESLLLRTVLRENPIPVDVIQTVELTLESIGVQQVLACGVVLTDDDRIYLRPRGVDPAELTETMRRWLQSKP